MIVIYMNTIFGGGIVNDYNGFTTSEIALTFTFSAYGESTGAAGDRGKLE